MNVIRMYLGLVVMCICISLINGAMSLASDNRNEH